MANASNCQPRVRKVRVAKRKESETYRRHRLNAEALDYVGGLALQNEMLAKTHWPELQPPVQARLPQFPMEALPQFVRQWVGEVSRMTATPPELAALLALAAGSAAAGNHCRVAKRDGWSEPLSLFTAVMMESGAQHSTVFKEAMLPLREWEAQWRDQYNRDEEGEPLPATIPRFLTEATDKIVLSSLREHGAAASFSASGGILRQLVGRNYLSLREQVRLFETAHDGEPILFQRTAKQFLEIAEPALACGLAIDPALAAGMAKSANFAGKSLLSRLLFAMPESSLGKREIAPPPISSEGRIAWRISLRNVLNVPRHSVLQVSPEADQLLRDWETELEPRLAEDAGPAGMREWLARLPSATRRIAAVMHLMKSGSEAPVSDMAMSSAIAIARYLVPHAQAALEKLGVLPGRTEDELEFMIRWTKEHGYRQFSRASAWQSVRRQFDAPEDLHRTLDELVRRGYLREVEVESSGLRGRSPSELYEVNPAVFGETPPEEPKPSIFDCEPEEDSQEAAKRKAEVEHRWYAEVEAGILRTYLSHRAIMRSIRRKRQKMLKGLRKKERSAVRSGV